MENSIVELLAKLGHHPIRKSGKEHIYHSMLRDDDHTPSFTVDDDLGVWYDHGTGKGGDYIKLTVLLGEEKPARRARKNFAVKLPHYRVEEVRETGHNPAISAYLAERGLWQQRHHLKEVYYYVLDEKHNKKEFFAAGSQNDLGGWEVRNKYFKGCLGKKALTTIPGNADKLCLFEGFLDYLSWKSDNPDDSATVIVLNSLALLTLVLKRMSSYEIIEIFFDHDAAGRSATTDLMKTVTAAKDMSDIYQGFKDYNDQLMTAFTNRTHTFK